MELKYASQFEPSRRGQVRFQASEILRFWNKDDLHRRVPANGSTGDAFTVAAVLPTQDLTVDDYDQLEELGVLVVEVPAEFAQEPASSIAAYLTEQLSAGVHATAARMAAIGTTGNPAQSAQDELQLSKEEEAELLDFVNDPANQLGGHF